MRCLFSSLWYHNLFADSSQIMPDSIWWLYLLSGLWYHNLPASRRWHPLFFKQLWFFQTLSDFYICFQDYDIKIYPIAEYDPHSFYNNSNLSRLYLRLYLLSKLWYQNLPDSGIWLYLRLYLLTGLWHHNLPASGRWHPLFFRTTLISPDSTWWLYLLSRLWYQNLPAGGRWHPLFF